MCFALWHRVERGIRTTQKFIDRPEPRTIERDTLPVRHRPTEARARAQPEPFPGVERTLFQTRTSLRDRLKSEQLPGPNSSKIREHGRP